MISKISFKNYKIFKRKQTLELKPITILIGKNNSGKTAVLKLPTMIERSLSGRFDSPFELMNDNVKIGNEYRDVIYGRNFREVELEIFQKKVLDNNVYDFLKTEIGVEENIPSIVSWNCNDILDLNKSDDNNIYHSEVQNKNYQVTFQGFCVRKIGFFNALNYEDEFLQLPKFELNTDFIGGIRTVGLPSYNYSSAISEKSGYYGLKLYDFLIADYLTTDKKYYTQISNFIKEKFERWEISIDVDGGRTDKPAIIFLEKEGLKINISETGTGISQVLPLVIRAYKPCKEETLIIIEEPESHLHPYAHAQLAQLYFDSLALDRNKKYLFETHSQNFVLRMRRLVAEGKLRPEDLAIYYVDFDEETNESELKSINVKEDGSVDFWPDGVFGETIIETRAIMSANINDVRNVD
ncbi:DUF3696 domain-containing protein [uncultured Chryseobacterium sp.]|uniref:AAA family ATPase n=1 Tax=uncultured Chryseobacterium sp. TaxID=259322 RepID=UPI0025ED5046|nr:DUF3696 domain-containing protein [uncultured Chryseobacterium sp.]